QGVPMRKLASLALFLCLLSGFAHATDKLTVFGGYQYTHLDPSFNLNGWNGAASVHFRSWIGLAAAVSRVYHPGPHLYHYIGGPEIRFSLPFLSPFAHALIGGGRSSSGGLSDTGLVAMAGGGVDVGSGPIGFRLVQFDWMDTHFNGFNNSKNV